MCKLGQIDKASYFVFVGPKPFLLLGLLQCWDFNFSWPGDQNCFKLGKIFCNVPRNIIFLGGELENDCPKIALPIWFWVIIVTTLNLPA